MSRRTRVVPQDHIERAIRLIRGERVLLDQDLALLYGVETRALVQAVKRNAGRFPDDFMFQLTEAEVGALTSQFVISSHWGGRRNATTHEPQGVLGPYLRIAI
jgi:hypothetical protein